MELSRKSEAIWTLILEDPPRMILNKRLLQEFQKLYFLEDTSQQKFTSLGELSEAVFAEDARRTRRRNQMQFNQEIHRQKTALLSNENTYSNAHKLPVQQTYADRQTFPSNK